MAWPRVAFSFRGPQNSLQLTPHWGPQEFGFARLAVPPSETLEAHGPPQDSLQTTLPEGPLGSHEPLIGETCSASVQYLWGVLGIKQDPLNL